MRKLLCLTLFAAAAGIIVFAAGRENRAAAHECQLCGNENPGLFGKIRRLFHHPRKAPQYETVGTPDPAPRGCPSCKDKNANRPAESTNAAASRPAEKITVPLKETAQPLAQFPAGKAEKISLHIESLSLGSGTIGFGVLAEYPAGPRALKITRRTAYDNPSLIKPNYFIRWGNLCNLRVYDPEGVCVAYLEMGQQNTKERKYEVPVPAGRSGIWRVSVSGGFANDHFILEMPETVAWGVRPERAMKIWQPFTDKGYMVFSPASDEIYCTSTGVTYATEKGPLTGEIGFSQHGKYAIHTHRPAGAETLELTFDWKNHKAVSVCFRGLPGLISPNKNMARRLNGGMVESCGEWLEGPLQARAWNYIHRWKKEDLDLKMSEEELLEVFGNWDGRFLARQNIDPTAPRFGGTNKKTKDVNHNFWDYSDSYYAPGIFAKLAAEENDKTRNRTYKNPVMIKRAIACAFHDFAKMDGSGMTMTMPGGPALKGQRLDTNTGFENFVGIGRGCYYLLPLLTPEERAIYREAALQVADKQQGFISYQSNQFMHILEGYCQIYAATREPRMEKILRMQLDSFIDNHFQGKHGQHESGFYLEEAGPDGNYDQMSLAPMANIYYLYQKQPGADKAFVAKIKACIEKNLRFRALFEVTNPANGKPYILAYCMNHRTEGPTHSDSHGGLKHSEAEFPMARTMLNLGTPLNPGEAPREILPFQKRDTLTELPGFFGIRRNSWYGVHFWRVYEKSPDGFIGPMFVWHEKAGMGLCGIRHSYHNHTHWFGADMDLNDITFNTVYGELDGKLFIPSRKMIKTLKWNIPGKSYTVTGTLYGNKKSPKDAAAPVRGTIAWTTTYADNDTVEMSVAVNFPELKNPVLNLSFLKQKGQTVWTHGGWRPYKLEGNVFTQESASGKFTLEFPAGTKAETVEKLNGNRGWVMALRLGIPADGKLAVTLKGSGK